MNMTILDPAHKRVVKEKNQQINALQAEKGDLQRALQAKAAEVVKAKMQAKGALDDAIYAHESRPLTPDAIADEMVERAAHCLARQQVPGAYSSYPDFVADMFCDEAHEVLRAALTEPPARPEGAEDIEAAFGTWERAEYLHAALDEDDLRSIADHIAEEMNR